MSGSKTRGSVDSLNIKFHQNNKMNNQLKHSAIQLKKLKTLLSITKDKILEIKGRKKFPSFHLVNENDKYKHIEKKIQKKILNISIKMIDNYKFDPDLKEFKPMKGQKLNKKSKKFTNSFIKRINASKARNSKKVTLIKQNELSRKIKRINNLYDSFGEDESDKDKEQGNFGLNPKNIFVEIYDIFLSLASIFCLLYIPYRLARTKLVINNNEHFVLFLINFSEIIYIIDLIFGFFRFYYNNEFKLVSNIYMITSHYLSTDFITDLIMAIPFFTILKFIEKDIKFNSYNTVFNEKHFLLKILICLKAFKIFKIHKIKNNRVFYFLNKKFTKNYYLERVYQIINFVFIICSLFNLIICYHIYFADLSYPNWIVSSNLQDKTFTEIYLASFYFIIATMTSVGYGDIVCISSEERYFQIILLSIGLVAYSWIISAVGDYVKNKSRAMDNFNRDMAKLEEIRIAYPNMPFKLYNKIQQHIQRMLTQNKKYEYNILVNSLPYYLQNSILFEIHKNEINKFTFFKNCDNSDFILKVLTHFIPIFSKKNIVLVGEGEFFENIFFIKDGRLSLEAIIDLDNIEMSIEKYLKYRFEEIEQIEEISDSENSSQKSSLKNIQLYKKKGKMKRKILIGMINKQFENIEEKTNLKDSHIDNEIGKCDFHTDIKDFYKGNIEYIHILDLLKNEHFGEILMFLNIPNPLTLRVKSKRVELYVLRKKDAFNIRKDYTNIWQRLNKKSIYNIKSLKSLTLDIIARYCEISGIIVKDREIIKSKYRTSYTKTYKSQFTSKTKSKFNLRNNTKFDIGKKMRTSLTSLPTMNKNKNLSDNNKKNKIKKIKIKKSKKSVVFTKKLNIKQDDNDNKDNNDNLKIKKTRSNSVDFHKEKTIDTIKKKLGTTSDISLTLSPRDKKPNLISKESEISLEIISSYKNINDMAKGQYINNNSFQNLIQKVIDYCIKINSLDKKYSDKFNSIKKKIINNKLNVDFMKSPNKTPIIEKNSLFSETNKNQNIFFNSIEGKYSKSSIEKHISLQNNNNITNQFIHQIHLNSFNISKNKEILLDPKNINSSNEILNEGNLKFENKSIQTFRNMKDIENNSVKEQELTKDKKVENLYSNNIIKNEAGHNIREVNLNYVNYYCHIY